MHRETDQKNDGMLGPRGMAPQEERRKSARFLLRDVRGHMSWQGEAGDIACEVDVLNISGGGAAVLSQDAPQEGQVLQLQLYGEAVKMESVEAVAQSAVPDASGKQVVRLRFARWVALDSILEKHRERRLWERYPARESRATLTWLEGTTEKTTPGDLLNISGGGAAFVGEAIPPPGVPIWFQLDASGRQVDRVDPVESRLVMTSLDPSGMMIAHIQFVDPCPMELFELAVNGTELE